MREIWLLYCKYEKRNKSASSNLYDLFHEIQQPFMTKKNHTKLSLWHHNFAMKFKHVKNEGRISDLRNLVTVSPIIVYYLINLFCNCFCL